MQFAVTPMSGGFQDTQPNHVEDRPDQVPLPEYPGMMLVVTRGPTHAERTLLAWVDGSETGRRCRKPLVVVSADHRNCYIMRDAFGGQPTLYLGNASFRLALIDAIAIANSADIPVIDSDD